MPRVQQVTHLASPHTQVLGAGRGQHQSQRRVSPSPTSLTARNISLVHKPTDAQGTLQPLHHLSGPEISRPLDSPHSCPRPHTSARSSSQTRPSVLPAGQLHPQKPESSQQLSLSSSRLLALIPRLLHDGGASSELTAYSKQNSFWFSQRDAAALRPISPKGLVSTNPSRFTHGPWRKPHGVQEELDCSLLFGTRVTSNTLHSLVLQLELYIPQGPRLSK